MSTTVKPAHLATQLRLFQPPRPDLQWAGTPLEHRQQVERLLGPHAPRPRAAPTRRGTGAGGAR
jgi:hypothetical protein